MNIISESEAKGLLSKPLECIDCPDWYGWKMMEGTVQTSMGLVDEYGVGTRLQVALRFHRSSKTKRSDHLFTVYKTEPHGLGRVYQLEIRQFPKPIKDEHTRPHEHWGARRIQGADSWATWSYEQILAYFSSQTKIIFKPPPVHPEAFELKRQ